MKVKTHLVNDDHSLEQFIDRAIKLYKEHGSVQFSWECGEKCSNSLKAIFHIFMREYLAHKAKVPVKMIPADSVESFKKVVKQRFYQETGHSFMIEKTPDPWHPEGERATLTSCKKWETGEMLQVLQWLEAEAACHGLILENKGEYKQLKQSQHY